MNTAILNLRTANINTIDYQVTLAIADADIENAYVYATRIDYSYRMSHSFAFSVYYILRIDREVRLEQVDELGTFVFDNDDNVVELYECLAIPGYILSFDDDLHRVENK